MTSPRSLALLPLLALAGCAPDALAPGEADTARAVAAFQYGRARTLHTWYSPSRGDYFTTADPGWAGRPGDTRLPDYRYVRAEGEVMDPAFPEPGSKPLYMWWSSTRGDNFLTTDPAWAGRPGDVRDGYVFGRVEGHVYATPVAGTLPLALYWNATHQDNYTTADPRVAAQDALRPGYVGGGIQGYVLPPSVSQVGATREDFGYGSLRVNGVPATGARALLVVMVQFRDQRFAAGDTCANRAPRFFGPSFPNAAGYFSENSNGRFTWRSAGCVNPVTARDVPSTPADESTFAGAMNARRDAYGQPAGEGREVLGQALADVGPGLDLGIYDSNGNGVIETQELTVVMVFPGPDRDDARAHNRFMISPWFMARDPATNLARAYRCEGQAAFVGEAQSFSTTMHELSHSLGTHDLYGSGNHSGGLTLMSGTGTSGAGDARTWHLDPWHKIRLGWIDPRIMPVTDEGNQLPLDAPQTAGAAGAEARRPVILYDPRRGLREYLLVEYRNRAPATGGGYDANLLDWRGVPSSRGVAVWHVMTDASHAPVEVPSLHVLQGPNGCLESAARGDDGLQNDDDDPCFDTINPGPDRVLQSTAAGDDLILPEYMVAVRGVTDPGSPVLRGNRGFSGLLRPEDGDYALTWYDGTPAVRLRSSTPSADGARVYVDWARGTRQLTARLDGASPSAQAGTSLELRGLLGARPDGRIPALRAPGALLALPVTAWSPTAVRVTVPATVAPGRYDLVVFNPSYLGASNAMQLDVFR